LEKEAVCCLSGGAEAAKNICVVLVIQKTAVLNFDKTVFSHHFPEEKKINTEDIFTLNCMLFVEASKKPFCTLCERNPVWPLILLKRVVPSIQS
jgi:hypothetical protein